MEILSLSRFDDIVKRFREGKVLVFPSETSYGIGCDAANHHAVDRIFKIKNRPKKKPLLAVVWSVEAAKKCLVWNDMIDQLAQKYWPGPLTIVGNCQKDTCLAPGVVSPHQTVAIRVTAHPFLAHLTKELNHPVVATSANISEAREIYDFNNLKSCFLSRRLKPDAAIDAGLLPKENPTTLVDATGDNIKILRQGAVKVLMK